MLGDVFKRPVFEFSKYASCGRWEKVSKSPKIVREYFFDTSEEIGKECLELYRKRKRLSRTELTKCKKLVYKKLGLSFCEKEERAKLGLKV